MTVRERFSAANAQIAKRFEKRPVAELVYAAALPIVYLGEVGVRMSRAKRS